MWDSQAKVSVMITIAFSGVRGVVNIKLSIVRWTDSTLLQGLHLTDDVKLMTSSYRRWRCNNVSITITNTTNKINNK